jgi:hypothetical protein
MLLALINVLIVIVVGAICFYLIDWFVRDGRLKKSSQNTCGLVLPCRNTATPTAGTRRELLGASQQLRQLGDIRRNPSRLIAPATRPQRPCIVADSNSFASTRAFSASALQVSSGQSKGTTSPRRFSGSSSHLRVTIDRFLRTSRFSPSIIRVVIRAPFVVPAPPHI